MGEKNTDQIDWFQLALVTSTPACLLQEHTEIMFTKFNISDYFPGEVDLFPRKEPVFGEFHDGTLMHERSREELLEYAKKYAGELRSLSLELIVRETQITQAIVAIERERLGLPPLDSYGKSCQ